MPDLLSQPSRVPVRTIIVYLSAIAYVVGCLALSAFAARALFERLPAIDALWPLMGVLAYYFLILLIADLFLALTFAFVFHGHIFAIIRFVTAGIFFVLPATLILFWLTVWFSHFSQLSPAASLLISLALLLLIVVLVAVYIYARFIEPHRLQTHFYRIHSPKLAPHDAPLRIVLLADVQTERITEYERRIFQETLSLTPDLILLAGDYLQCPDESAYQLAAQSLQALLNELHFTAPLGVFAVPGHSERCCVHDCFEGTSVRWLADRTILLTHNNLSICLTGLSLDTGSSLVDIPALLIAELDSAHFNIFFSHQPDFVLDLPPGHSIDLCLAGHTHGGQICLPFVGPLVTFCRLPRSRAHGLHFINNSTLCISRGLGMERGWAPPLRFLCPPEIVVLDLIPRS